MDALGLMVFSDGGLVSFLLLALIISLLANLVFVNKRLLEKLQIKKQDKLAPETIKKYLYEQAEKTLNNHKFHYIPKLHELVVKFRSAYLKIEAKCIDRTIDSKEYWNLLNAKLNELFKLAANYSDSRGLLGIKKKIELIKSLVRGSEKLINKDKIVSGLDKFYEACRLNSDEKKVLEYDKNLNKLILRLTNKYYARLDNLVRINDEFVGGSREAISRLEESIRGVEDIPENAGSIGDPVYEDIAKCKESNKEIRDGVENCRLSLDALEMKLYAIKGADYSGESDETMHQTAKDLSALSEQIQLENEREIERLRKVVKDQKNTIRELDEKLREILGGKIDSSKGVDHGDKEKGEKEKGDKSDQSIIELLTNNLRDAEYCISVLEDEMEMLKQKAEKVSKEFSQAGDVGVHSINAAEAENLQKTVEGLRKEVEQKGSELELMKTIASFSMDVFQGKTFEDLSLLLYQTLSELKVNVVLKIYAPARTFDICTSGKIPKRLSTVIDNLQVNESNANSNSVFFKFSYIGGAVQSVNNEVLVSEQVSYILMINQIANSMFDVINLLNKSRTRHQKIESCENQIKRASSEIDGAFDKIYGQAVAAMEDSFRQIREISRSAGLSATQVARFNSIENAAVADIKSEGTVRLKLKKAFLEALRELESMRN